VLRRIGHVTRLHVKFRKGNKNRKHSLLRLGRRLENILAINNTETRSKDNRWMKLSRGRVEWSTLGLKMLNIRVLLSQC
jgi:hypothetical protein